ncbi:subtype B tannase [Streptomyces sp. NBC_00038]|uniref:subtype B tannase n=1 Tax=Streptomyces sp. NBC_00038 TaxID=2903615 RepID=UPI00225B116B|nr:subtype B tannase [Streptomyces sp. NBC_00038]MCX5557855.1 Tat pathway signal protein [Streptomyces sp. NBC_00038]
MQRRHMVKVLAAAAAIPAVAGSAGGAWASPAAKAPLAADPLAFDPATYTTLTTSVTTADGVKAVTYRFYKAIPYVAEPVDVTYQTLNVSVPVEIDGVAVDASHAPILFNNAVGGYMPSSTAGNTGIGRGTNPGLALASGYIVAEPGARGRSLVDAEGVYYGVAPAAIVDLKAAVRYLRHNKGRVPGNTDRIVATGVSAGGALTSLLGATGDSRLYDSYLSELGAADASDSVFAAAPYCPITDLEHADMAYEWNWGTNPLSSGAQVDQALSKELRSNFAEYQASLKLKGKGGFGRLTARNYDEYLVRTYLEPSATKYLAALSDADRTAYLAAHPGITWSAGKASFAWSDFLTHVGARKKNVPSFDLFDLSSGENNLFGVDTTKARHFTEWSLRKATGDAAARLDTDLPEKIELLNPMPFIERKNPHRARNWFIRVGTKDSDTSLTVVGNLAASLENLGDHVDTYMYWDGGHGANQDAPAFMTWIGRVTGYTR